MDIAKRHELEKKALYYIEFLEKNISYNDILEIIENDILRYYMSKKLHERHVLLKTFEKIKAAY